MIRFKRFPWVNGVQSCRSGRNRYESAVASSRRARLFSADTEFFVSVPLRGHHLFCVLTYVGEGYSPAFVANLDETVAELASGRAAEIVSGPDRICGALLAEDACAHCLSPRVALRDERALAAASRILGRPLQPGDRVLLDRATVARLRDAFLGRSRLKACAGCEWTELCRSVARSGFEGAKLRPVA
jgi:hypothetical protein